MISARSMRRKQQLHDAVYRNFTPRCKQRIGATCANSGEQNPKPQRDVGRLATASRMSCCRSSVLNGGTVRNSNRSAQKITALCGSESHKAVDCLLTFSTRFCRLAVRVHSMQKLRLRLPANHSTARGESNSWSAQRPALLTMRYRTRLCHVVR